MFINLSLDSGVLRQWHSKGSTWGWGKGMAFATIQFSLSTPGVDAWCVLKFLPSAPRPSFPVGQRCWLLGAHSWSLPQEILLAAKATSYSWDHWVSRDWLMGVKMVRVGMKWEGHEGAGPGFSSGQFWRVFLNFRELVGWAESSLASVAQLPFSLCPVLHPSLPYMRCSWEYPTINHLYANLWFRNQLLTTLKAISTHEAFKVSLLGLPLTQSLAPEALPSDILEEKLLTLT